MESPYTDNRQEHLVYAHGLMIFHMMFFHLCVSTLYNTPLYYPLLHSLSFFMAWFFFKSGMFIKERSISQTLIYGVKKLLIPALVFSLIGYITYFLFERPQFNISNEFGFFYVFGAFRGNVPMWFLFSMFIVQISFKIMRKCNLQPWAIAFIALIFYFIDKYIGFRPYWTYNIPLGLFFYSLGFTLKELQYKKIIQVVSLIVFFGLFFFRFEINFRDGLFDPYFITIPWTLAGCILTNNLFKRISQINISPLRFLGIHAMEFYCIHIIILYIIEQIYRISHIGISRTFFIASLFAIALIIISLLLHFIKYDKIQWVFGRNN